MYSDVIESFERMTSDLQRFASAFNTEKPVTKLLWEPVAPPKTTLTAYTNLWHEAHGDGRATERLYGVVGCSPDLLALARQVNISKTLFQQSVKATREQQRAEVLGHLSAIENPIRTALNYNGLGRLHLKQCYRLLPIFDERPDSIRFSWYTSGRSIKKITATQCLELLCRFDQSQPHIQRQLDLLKALSDSDDLAQVQEQKPLVRANFAWRVSENTWRRSARNCPLPILLPLDNGQTLPKLKEPTPEPPERSRSVRSDRIIEDTPFLPSIRVHRYIG